MTSTGQLGTEDSTPGNLVLGDDGDEAEDTGHIVATDQSGMAGTREHEGD